MCFGRGLICWNIDCCSDITSSLLSVFLHILQVVFSADMIADDDTLLMADTSKSRDWSIYYNIQADVNTDYK